VRLRFRLVLLLLVPMILVVAVFTYLLVQEERAGEWSVIASSNPAEKVSSTVSRFRVRVPPRGESVLTYRLRVIW